MSDWNRTIQTMNYEARAERAPAARTREDIERALNAARKSLDWFSRQPERAQRCRIPGYGNIYGPSLTRSIARLEKELASFDRAAADLAATGVAVMKDGERIPPEDFFAEAGDTPDLRKILKNCAENVVIGVDMGWDMGGIVYSMHDACVAFTRQPAASRGGTADDREHAQEIEMQEIADGAYGDGPFTRGLARDAISKQADPAEDSPLTIADYEEVLADKRRLVRELDVAMHGEDGAAKQASLCDLIEPAREMRAEIARLKDELRFAQMPPCFACGARVTEDCRRSLIASCGREHNGGSRTALAGASPPRSSAVPPMIVEYTNWRGETAIRRLRPISIRYGSTPWHPAEQWLLLAFDQDKGETREFAMRDMRSVDAKTEAAP